MRIRGALQRFLRFLRGPRGQVLGIFLSFGIGASLTWHYREAVFAWLLAPARGKLSPYGLPVYSTPTDMLGVTIGLAMKGGIVAAIPMVTVGILRVTRPFLPRRFWLFIVLFLPAVLMSYAGGVAFAYFVMLPTGLRFLLNFGTNIAVPMIQITAYLSLVMALLFWLGIVFELPLVMFLLTKLRLISLRRWQKLRKYVPVTALILGALVTPTFDVVNQMMVTVPMIALYEVGLVLSWLAEGRVGPVIGAWTILVGFVVDELRGLWAVGMAREGRRRDVVERRIVGPYWRTVQRLRRG
jgi:sec-independent protein translocase protein TatC